MSSQLQLIALSITKTKNKEVFMVSTKQGMFSVRKAYLDKRGINTEEIWAGNVFKFAEPTVVVVQKHKKGDYLFPDNGGVATQDSSRLDGNGNPMYVAGDKPTWSEDGATVRSFVAFAEFKAQLELEKLVAGVA